MTSTRVCTFWVGELLLGIDVDNVVEIARELVPTPVPLSDPSVSGLVNLRGRILTAVDARRLLQLHEPVESDDPTGGVSIIVAAQDDVVALIVDREGDIVQVADYDREPVPETISVGLRSRVSGAFQVPGALLLVLDSDRVLVV